MYNIFKLYRKKILHKKMKQMIAMSAVITVVTATTMQLKIDSSNQMQIQELYDQIDSDPNYPMIPSTKQIVNSGSKDISKILYPSKLVQLLDHLLLMNMCASNDEQLPNETNISKPKSNKLRNITYFKSIVFFNYFKAIKYTS